MIAAVKRKNLSDLIGRNLLKIVRSSFYLNLKLEIDMKRSIEIMDRLPELSNSKHESSRIDRFMTLDNMKSNSSLATERENEGSFIFKGKIIKVIRKGPKYPVGPGSYNIDPQSLRK